VKDRTAAKNRKKVRNPPLLKRQNAQRLEQIFVAQCLAAEPDLR
jgi:hypothetical protein